MDFGVKFQFQFVLWVLEFKMLKLELNLLNIGI